MARVEGQGNNIAFGQGDQAAQFASILDALKGATPPGKGLEGLMNSIESGTDGDNDKHITANELSQYMGIPLEQAEAFLQKYNTTTEGETTPGLDAAELTAAFEERAAEEAEEAEEGNQPPVTEEEAAAAEQEAAKQSMADLSKLMSTLIGGEDGQMSPEELEAFTKKYDTNGDGQLSKEELAAGLKAEAKAKGADLSDLQIDTLLSKADTGLTAADINGDQNLSNDEIATMLSTSSEADA